MFTVVDELLELLPRDGLKRVVSATLVTCDVTDGEVDEFACPASIFCGMFAEGVVGDSVNIVSIRYSFAKCSKHTW